MSKAGSETTLSSIQAALDAYSKKDVGAGPSSQPLASLARDAAEHLKNLPPELRPLFPRNPEEINKIIERAAKDLPGYDAKRRDARSFDDEVEAEVDRVLREVEEESEADVQANIDKRAREALDELERIEREADADNDESNPIDPDDGKADEAKEANEPKVSVDDEDDEDLKSNNRPKTPWKELRNTPPKNIPDQFPPHLYEPYADVEEPLETSATAEFEAAFAYHPQPISEPKQGVENNAPFDDPLAASLRTVMLETYEGGDAGGIDEQVRRFMSELDALGGDPTYEDPFEALNLESSSRIGDLATGLDDVVGELGDFAANPDLFKEFSSLLQTEREDVEVDEPGAVVELAEEDAVGVSTLAQREWDKLERQAAAGEIDFLSGATHAKEEAERVANNVEMERSDGKTVDYAEGGPEDVLLGEDPWNSTYVFPKANSYRVLIPVEALEKGLAARFTSSPEVVLGYLEASLDAIPGREALSDAKRGWAWLNLGLHHSEQGAVGRSVAALREACRTASGLSSDAKLSDVQHPLRIVARATAELALIYGRGLDSRRALILVRRWLTLAAEIWGEDAVMADDPDEVEDDDELALTDTLRSRLKDALERHSDDADALAAASILHTLARDAPRAKDALLAAAHARPSDPLSWRRLAVAQGPGADTIRALRRAADLRPFDANSWTRVGHAYSAVYNYERAAPYLLRALALLEQPADVEMEEMEGDSTDIADAVDKAAPVWTALANCVQALGHHELEHSIRQKDVDAFRAYFTF